MERNHTLTKNNTVSLLQQVAGMTIRPCQASKGQHLPQKLYNSGF
jgi:hypothetical protein